MQPFLSFYIFPQTRPNPKGFGKENYEHFMFNYMGYLRRPKYTTRRARKPNGRCRRHPKHQQPPGVCSLCLREKLFQLSIGASSRSSSSRGREDVYSSGSSSSSLSPYESSSSGSSLSSPGHRYRFEKGYGLFGGKDVLLVKSRSISFVPRQKGKEGGEHQNKGKGGFWSKLIHAGGRKTGAGSAEGLNLKHSKTVGESESKTEIKPNIYARYISEGMDREGS